MLLSTSELFWVGLIQGTLSAATLEPPEDLDYFVEPPPTLYDIIGDYADLCGLGKSIIERESVKQDCSVDIADLRWGRNGEILTAWEISECSSALAALASENRDLAMQADPSGRLAKRFSELLEEHAPIAFGYSPRTSSILYGLKKSGRIVVVARVTKLPNGIIRVLLRLLVPHIDTPPAGFMALAASGDPVPPWHESWIPSQSSLTRPLQDIDRQAGIDAIDRELIGAAREETAYLLGRNIGHAEHLLRNASDWLAYERNTLASKSLHTQALDFIPDTKNTEQLGNANDDDGEDDQVFESFSGAEQSALQAEETADDESPHDEWAEEINKVMKAACTQVGLGAVDLPPAQNALLRHVTAALDSLETSKSLARKLGIDTFIPSLDKGIASASALVNEARLARGMTPGAWLTQQETHRESLMEYPDVLRHVVPLAFGELRLRELISDHHWQGLEPSSMEGWSKLVDNARGLVRDAPALMKNGLSPLMCINAVQLALETIVRMLAAKHLESYRGNDLGNILHALLHIAKDKNDAQLEFVASVGLSLRILRNEAVHEPDRAYDKHDAAFFLNGLAIMLRALA